MMPHRNRIPGLPLWILLVGLGTAPPSRAAERWFQLDRSSWFTGWRDQLQELVDGKPGTAPGPVCAVGWQGPDPASLQAYVIWPAGHELVTWRPTRGDPHSLVDETNVIDLRKDVVADEAAVNGSTYLVTRAWVRRIRSRCRSSGNTLELTPHAERSRG